jgi:predicted metal-binding membrane protein
MLLFIPLGVMNIPAMAGLAAVIFAEKLWRLGPVFSAVIGVVFLVFAVLAPFQDWLLPGLQSSGSPMGPMS